MKWNTGLTKLLGCKYPIMEGALTGLGSKNGDFAAAVSETGAVGCLTAHSYKTPDKLRDAIRKLRDTTENPFTVNITIGMFGNTDELLDTCIEENVPCIETRSSGDSIFNSPKKSGDISLSMLTDAISAEDTVYDHDYSYDDVGNLVSTDKGTALGIKYDNVDCDDTNAPHDNNRINKICIGSTAYVNMTHNGHGDITEIDNDFPPPNTIAMSYEETTGRLKKVELGGIGGTELLSMRYDDQGRRTAAWQTGEDLRFYHYDIFGRMITEIHRTTGQYNENPVLDFVYLGNHRVAMITGQANNPCFIATAAAGVGIGAGSHFSVGAGGAGSFWTHFAPMTKTDLDALRAFRDKVLKKFGAGQAFIKWYYREGKEGAAWLNQNPGWKPVVRLAHSQQGRSPKAME